MVIKAKVKCIVNRTTICEFKVPHNICKNQRNKQAEIHRK